MPHRAHYLGSQIASLAILNVAFGMTADQGQGLLSCMSFADINPIREQMANMQLRLGSFSRIDIVSPHGSLSRRKTPIY